MSQKSGKDSEVLKIQVQLTEAAEEWNTHHRDASFLYRGARLSQANEHSDGLGGLERDFLDASNNAQAIQLNRTMEKHKLITAQFTDMENKVQGIQESQIRQTEDLKQLVEMLEKLRSSGLFD